MGIPLRVLIVEDRPEDADLMVYELRRAGFDLEWDLVWNEPDFLNKLNNEYDVILADYSLPQFNALRALHLAQERGLTIPFIVVTGALGDERAAEIIKHGATDYLLKDRPARLGLAIVSAIGEKSTRQFEAQQQAALRDVEEKFSVRLVLAGVRHEITNHLTTILGPAQLIRRRTSDLATRKSLDRIITSSRSIIDLIDRMEDLFPAYDSLKPKAVSSQPPQESEDAEPSKRQGRVLIIEDDANLGSLLLDMLKDQHDVVGCLSKEDVIQGKFASVEYDVVLVDVALGGMLISRLTSASAPQRESAVFVAIVEHDFESRLGEFRPDFVVQKPFDLDELLDAVARGVSVYDARVSSERG